MNTDFFFKPWWHSPWNTLTDYPSFYSLKIKNSTFNSGRQNNKKQWNLVNATNSSNSWLGTSRSACSRPLGITALGVAVVHQQKPLKSELLVFFFLGVFVRSSFLFPFPPHPEESPKYTHMCREGRRVKIRVSLKPDNVPEELWRQRRWV